MLTNPRKDIYTITQKFQSIPLDTHRSLPYISMAPIFQPTDFKFCVGWFVKRFILSKKKKFMPKIVQAFAIAIAIANLYFYFRLDRILFIQSANDGCIRFIFHFYMCTCFAIENPDMCQYNYFDRIEFCLALIIQFFVCVSVCICKCVWLFFFCQKSPSTIASVPFEK